MALLLVLSHEEALELGRWGVSCTDRGRWPPPPGVAARPRCALSLDAWESTDEQEV
eukprot:CAMPEP_0174923822 /NCGR_PEP_ID=MMETSP1355-20121228/6843_1 /TAXON_ID=464990 /ORGANISM="Hemiselmis tepida, Strain CCMP443" /LENGTH=55 /DNA_ID=CAMNT_0016169555 /DNA_START=93 /DNA_END=260 /DNA_ORIENTATION=-